MRNKKFVGFLTLLLLCLHVVNTTVVAQVTPPPEGIEIPLPSQSPIVLSIPTGLFGVIAKGGIFAYVGYLGELFFVFLLLIWVILVIYSTLTIVRSGGEQQAKEKGIKTIRNILYGITAMIVFIMGISLVGVWFGFGAITSWSQNLYQCGNGYGSFFFAAAEREANRRAGEGFSGELYGYCCQDIPSTIETNPDMTWKFLFTNVDDNANCKYISTIKVQPADPD